MATASDSKVPSRWLVERVPRMPPAGRERTDIPATYTASPLFNSGICQGDSTPSGAVPIFDERCIFTPHSDPTGYDDVDFYRHPLL